MGTGFLQVDPLVSELLRGSLGAYDPGAYKIRTGVVPDRSRGSGHTTPTYARRDHAGS